MPSAAPVVGSGDLPSGSDGGVDLGGVAGTRAAVRLDIAEFGRVAKRSATSWLGASPSTPRAGGRRGPFKAVLSVHVRRGVAREPRPGLTAGASGRIPPSSDRGMPMAVQAAGAGPAQAASVHRPSTPISSPHSRLLNPLPACSTASPASIRRTTASIPADSVAAPIR